MGTHPAVTSHEVARLTGVPQSAVLKVLRGSSHVTREGSLAMAQDMDAHALTGTIPIERYSSQASL